MIGKARAWAAALALAGAGAACGGSSHHASPPAPTTVPAPVVATSTTVPGAQTSGRRTVLSPIGLHVRAQPSTTAKVLGTAAQGVALTVLGHTDQSGGWYEVRGATVTGWISASATLSAPGTFAAYSSSTLKFSVLYPANWTVKASPSAIDFAAAGEKIAVTSATTFAQLSQGQTGFAQTASEKIIVCGETTNLVSYTGSAVPHRYLAQIGVTLDATHALGIVATFSTPEELQTVRNFGNSVTFPYPPCGA